MRNGRYIDNAGTVRRYLNDQLHRIDGPAVEWANGTRMWYLNGQRHRTDGPAFECADGYYAWYVNGKHFKFADWLEHLNTTPETRTLLMLKWSSNI